jgi:NADPH:quinone reductase-like Zn-dependent oxidoreductase
VLAWVAEDKIRAHIAETLTLAEAFQAHQLFEARQVAGKLLLAP